MIDANIGPRKISTITKIPESTVKYTKKKAQERDQDQHDLPRSGRPRKTSKSQDARSYRYLKHHSNMTGAEISKTNNLKRSSMRRRLLKIDPNLRRRKCLWRPLLRQKDAYLQFQHAGRYKCWRTEDLAKVCWSDECTIAIGRSETDCWHWMHSREQYLPKNIMKHSRNHETMMIWAAMLANGVVV